VLPMPPVCRPVCEPDPEQPPTVSAAMPASRSDPGSQVLCIGRRSLTLPSSNRPRNVNVFEDFVSARRRPARLSDVSLSPRLRRFA
jgi:hypothetical protein